MNIDISKELTIAKAAFEAGNFLRKNKNILNKTISSTNRDVKLHTHIEALILNQNEKFQVDISFSNSFIKT